MSLKKILKNPLDLLAEYMAPRRNVPVDIMRVRSRYLFFSAFPEMFNQEEYLYLYKNMLDIYIKTLDVVYGNYPQSSNKFILPSKRLNNLFMHLNGYMLNVVNNPRYESTCKVPTGRFSELRLNHQRNIQLWASTKADYMELMSQITQDICLKTRYGLKPEPFFRLLFDLLGLELQKHIFNRINRGNDVYFDVPFPPSFCWIDNKTFSLGNDLFLEFDKSGAPKDIFSHLLDQKGAWVTNTDLTKLLDISDDSLRTSISVLRKKIATNPKIAQRIGIQNDGSGSYRLGMRFILSSSVD